MSYSLRTILLSLALWQIGWAQNWALFPAQERAYYLASHQQQLFDYYPDSVSTQGNATAHYIGANAYAFPAGVPDSCAYQPWVASFEMNGLSSLADRDTVWRQGDRWYAFSAGDSIWFDALAQPGESWTISLPQQADLDSLVVSCLSAGDSSFWGQTDSVKWFAVQAYQGGNPVSTPLDSLAPILSQKHGMLAFAPLSRWLTAPQRAVQQGRTQAGQDLGYTADFLDFFGQWQPGDLRKYETTVTFSGEPVRRERDSLTAVDITAQAVILTYNRQHYRGPYTANGTNFPDSLWTLSGLRDTLRRDENGAFLDSVAPQWLLRVNPTYLREDRHMASLGKLVTFRRLDRLFDACAFGSSLSGNIIDDQRLAEGLGLVYSETGMIAGGNRETTIRRLIAWDTQYAGQYGDFSQLTLGVPKAESALVYAAFPNPTTQGVRLQGLLPHRATHIELWSPQGVRLRAVDLPAGESNLSLTGLPAGLYLLRIAQGEQGGYSRVLKR